MVYKCGLDINPSNNIVVLSFNICVIYIVYTNKYINACENESNIRLYV